MAIYNHKHETYLEFERADEIQQHLANVKDFVMDICPNEWKPIAQKNCENYDFMIIDPKTRMYTQISQGQEIERQMPSGAGGYNFVNNYINNEQDFSCTFAAAIHPKASKAQIDQLGLN